MGCLPGYERLDKIGYGKCGIVFKGRRISDQEEVAMKYVDSARNLNLEREYLLYFENKQDYSPHLIKYYEIVDNYLIMEYFPGITLDLYMKTIEYDCRDVLHIITQIAQGIKYLHDNNVAHRDIKCENILIDEKGLVKIIDMGFTMLKFNDVEHDYAKGSPIYMPPQTIFLTDMSFESLLGQDMWGVGVILYKMLYKNYPYNADTLDEFRNLLKTTQKTFCFQHDDEKTQTIINDSLINLLQHDLSLRYNIDDLLSTITSNNIYFVTSLGYVTRGRLILYLRMLGNDVTNDVSHEKLEKLSKHRTVCIIQGQKIYIDYVKSFAEYITGKTLSYINSYNYVRSCLKYNLDFVQHLIKNRLVKLIKSDNPSELKKFIATVCKINVYLFNDKDVLNLRDFLETKHYYPSTEQKKIKGYLYELYNLLSTY